LSGAGVPSRAAADAITSGVLGGTHSAARQDWHNPGQATLNTLWGAGSNAVLAYGGVKVMNTLDDLIRANWYGTPKPTAATKWPETPEELSANNSGSGYNKGTRNNLFINRPIRRYPKDFGL
jgi:hypothetical protein